MKEAIIGIDFGSSGTGFAYSISQKNFLGKQTFDKFNINHGTIFGANVDNKVPTEIILDDNDYTVQFGADCVKYLKEKGLNVGHYFKDIKMELYWNNKYIKAKNSGKKLELKLVIQRILEEVKRLALKEIKKIRPFIKEKNIKWVVTVPAIWQEYQKNIMMKACIDAGLIGENDDKSLFFALEPEAIKLIN